MKNNKTISIIVYSFLILIIIMNEFMNDDSKNSLVIEKNISNLDSSYLDKYFGKIDKIENQNLWLMDKSTPVNLLGTTADSAKNLKIEKDKNKNRICIEKECTRLVGIFKLSSSDTFFVTLYNENTKKIKSYEQGETLIKDLIISEISRNKVKFIINDSNQSWEFKTFDIDKEKYKPKEIK